MALAWRFIPFAEFDGATNMAIDLQLLQQCEAGAAPVLRLYGFSPPCLTLGLNQKLAEETLERVRQRGYDIVRRPTGGRAVLHLNDLTYSFVARQKGEGEFGVLETSVSAAYKQICAGLQAAFDILGLRAELGASSSAYRHLADCFLATTNADLHHAGRKLAGSAQLRRRGTVLQHGSIPLNLDQNIMADLLGLERKEEGSQRHANLFEILRREVSMAELNEAMKDGFAKAFSVEFSERVLLPEEIEDLDLREFCSDGRSAGGSPASNSGS